jgi:hypothetical protein
MSDTEDQNKAAINQFFIDGIGNANLGVIAALLSPDYQYCGQPSSVKDNQTWVTGLHQQCPGLVISIEQMLAEDDLVALRWRMDVPAHGITVASFATATNIITMLGGQAVANTQTPMYPSLQPLNPPPASPPS